MGPPKTRFGGFIGGGRKPAKNTCFSVVFALEQYTLYLFTFHWQNKSYASAHFQGDKEVQSHPGPNRKSGILVKSLTIYHKQQ